jgi:hypothetical protein
MVAGKSRTTEGLARRVSLNELLGIAKPAKLSSYQSPISRPV